MGWHGKQPKKVIDSEYAKAKAIDWTSFTKISAVEGIRLKPAMEKRAAEAASKGLSAEEYRKAIVRSYRKA